MYDVPTYLVVIGNSSYRLFDVKYKYLICVLYIRDY